MLGIIIVFGIALLPTSINLFAIQSLLAPDSFIDFGSVLGSYLGLIFVGLLFMVISLISSLLFQNQVVSFLVAVLGCFSQFYLWFFIADFTTNNALFKFINEIGIYAHYLNISRGVLTFKTTLYFTGFLTGYFLLGVQQVENKGGLIKVIKMPLIIFIGTLLAVYLSNKAHFQLDLTVDKRYSLSPSTISKIQTLDEPIRLDVFLS